MKWRSEGEYWRGTWDDEARQQCADDLLLVLGEDPKTFTLAHAEVEAALEDYALPGHPSNADRLTMLALRERDREERAAAWDELAKLAEAEEP